MFKVGIIQGPNLNLLGQREPEIYGQLTSEELTRKLKVWGQAAGLEVEIFQSNHEGFLVDKIQEMADYDYLIINAAAYAHTSIALRDALLAVKVPALEVHLSNLARREAFRQRSLLADIVRGQICGLGVYGYYLALQAVGHFLRGDKTDD